jgi:type I restriction enzyme, S subunit
MSYQLSWPSAKLGEICTVVTGGTPPKSNPKYYGGNIPWIKPDNLDKEMYVTESSEYLSIEGAEVSRLLPTGSVLVSCIGNLGKVAIAGKPLATNQQINSLIPSKQIDSEYLYYACSAKRNELSKLAAITIVPIVNKSAFSEIEIPLPPIEEQRQIAARLKAQLAEVEKVRQAAGAQLQDSRLLRSRLLKEFFAEFDAAPKKKLGDYARTTSGSTPSRSNKQYWHSAEIAWVKTGEVAFAPITATEEAISKTALAECSLTLLPPKTVLIAMYGQGKTRGQSAILEIPATTNQACFAILPNDTWESDFLYLWLKSAYQNLRDLSEDRGGNQANLNGALLKALDIPAPSKTAQQKMVARSNAALTEIDALENSIKATLEDINRLPSRLLSQAFTQLNNNTYD